MGGVSGLIINILDERMEHVLTRDMEFGGVLPKSAVLACAVDVVRSFVQPKRIVSSAQAKQLGGQTRHLTLSADDSIFPISIPIQDINVRSSLLVLISQLL